MSTYGPGRANTIDGSTQQDWSLRCFESDAIWFGGSAMAEWERRREDLTAEAQAARWPDDGGVVVMGLEVRAFETNRMDPLQFEAQCTLLAPGCKTLSGQTADGFHSPGYYGYVVMVALCAPLWRGTLPSLVSGVLEAYATQGRLSRTAFLTLDELRVHRNQVPAAWKDWLDGVHAVDTKPFVSLLIEVLDTPGVGVSPSYT